MYLLPQLGSEYVSLGGRDAEMTFGIGDITYTELYDTPLIRRCW